MKKIRSLRSLRLFTFPLVHCFTSSQIFTQLHGSGRTRKETMNEGRGKDRQHSAWGVEAQSQTQEAGGGTSNPFFLDALRLP